MDLAGWRGDLRAAQLPLSPALLTSLVQVAASALCVRSADRLAATRSRGSKSVRRGRGHADAASCSEGGPCRGGHKPCRLVCWLQEQGRRAARRL